VFGHLLNAKSFDSPKRPLTRKQTFLPITFGYIKRIPTITITPTNYLGNWALVTSIIIDRLMVNRHPFFVKALAQVDNTFLFQQHFKVACNLLLTPTWACLPPFEQFIGQKRFIFKIPFRNIYTIITSPICSLMGYLKPIMPKFLHVSTLGRAFGL
jgi:hypothetical protein